MIAQQHHSHQGLLAHVEAHDRPPESLDAIIVPAGRPVGYLEQALAVAGRLGVPLLVLCSLQAGASSAVLAAKRAGVGVTAVDTKRVPAKVVPEFATDRLLSPGCFRRLTDTSFKRNLGLLIALLAGWKRILFLDDDIVLPEPADLTLAAGLLGKYPVVGLANAGMPDNSVVCHARRAVGHEQDTFIGGGALAVDVAAFESFFPNIYNEDWFFMLDGRKLRPSAVTGTAIQHPYDPYLEAGRARGEELGDTLAEGVFSLLDSRLGLAKADERYWRDFLWDRRRIIEVTIGEVHDSPVGSTEKSRMVAALQAALGRSKLITPSLCMEYLRDWQEDCVRWRTRLDQLRRDHCSSAGLERALIVLGIGQLAHAATVRS